MNVDRVRSRLGVSAGLAFAAGLALSTISPVRADPCRAHCRDKARVCKDRCKLHHPEGASPERHQCLKECELREHECRAHC
jgi:hypothetical protein